MSDDLLMLFCPTCALPAVLEDRYTLRSTDGPVDHVKIRCFAGHFFNCPLEMVTDERN